jgi:hypothetical protein
VTFDLSKEASDRRLAAQREAKRKTGHDGGLTGTQLIDRAAQVFDVANRLQKQTQRTPAGRRRDQVNARADEALRTAAVQIRIAQATPLDRGYLHALDLPKIQQTKAEVGRAFDTDPAALAVDTHRRIQDQRNRRRVEGAPPAPNRRQRRRHR